jgi:3-hydroxyisobutyrate dehydrogenase-like beta-hydroxyacid dehydrogenase
VSEPLPVGFVGLGDMGAPMARHLLRRGFPTTVTDVRPDAVAALVTAGAKPADTPAEIADAADVLAVWVPRATTTAFHSSLDMRGKMASVPAWGWSRSMSSMRPQVSVTHDRPDEALTTSMASASAMPSAAARRSASSATRWLRWSMTLLTSFMVWPVPTGPRWKIRSA